MSLDTLNQAFLTRKAVVGVMGLGYVGLPLVKALGDKGFHVIGFDVDVARVKTLKEGTSYIKSFPQESLAHLLKEKRFEPTHTPADLARMDAILICVPTPLTRHREPDMSYVVATAETILPNLRKGQLIVLESTTYPGTTKRSHHPYFRAWGFESRQRFLCCLFTGNEKTLAIPSMRLQPSLRSLVQMIRRHALWPCPCIPKLSLKWWKSLLPQLRKPSNSQKTFSAVSTLPWSMN